MRIIGDFWVEASAHLNVCSVTLNTHFCSFFFFVFNRFLHAGFDSPPLQSKVNQPPTEPPLISPSFPACTRRCTALIALHSPSCLPVFQLQSLLTLISFVSSKLSQPSLKALLLPVVFFLLLGFKTLSKKVFQLR